MAAVTSSFEAVSRRSPSDTVCLMMVTACLTTLTACFTSLTACFTRLTRCRGTN